MGISPQLLLVLFRSISVGREREIPAWGKFLSGWDGLRLDFITLLGGSLYRFK